MCLTYNKENTEKYYEKIRKFSAVTVYKVVMVRASGRLGPPYRDFAKAYNVGYYHSNTRRKPFWQMSRNLPNKTDITRGFHVCLSKKVAEDTKSELWYSDYKRYKIVKVRVHPEDLIGVNDKFEKAVFTKAYFFKKDFI